MLPEITAVIAILSALAVTVRFIVRTSVALTRLHERLLRIEQEVRELRGFAQIRGFKHRDRVRDDELPEGLSL